MTPFEAVGRFVGDYLLFSDFLESDQRTPCVTFSLPDSVLRLLRMEGGGNEFGLLAPRLEFWIAMIAAIGLLAAFNTLVSCVIYQCIVLPQKQTNMKKDKQINDSMAPFLVGFGIIMPLSLVTPYYAIQFFRVKNKIIKFFFCVTEILAFFRCSEAMFGFLPPSVDDSLGNLIVYNAFPLEPKFNNGVVKSTWSSTFYFLRNWVKYIFILGFYSSVLLAFDYQPYPSSEGTKMTDIDILHGFTRQMLINNTLIVILFQVYLTTFGHGMNTLVTLLGIEPIPMMLNPIFESRSPSDFWGRRWNLVVHGILKRGVYKPVRMKFSRFVASLATFVASGLFHEWLLMITLHYDVDEGSGSCTPPNCFIPGYGRNTLFFVWNTLLISLEYALGGAAVFQLAKKHVPLTLLSLMVTSTALPVAHWFTNDYVRSDFFKDVQLGFPIVVRL
ncbi:hypothetical protein ACHAWF_008754 [Thalassiosira exigua]